MQEEAIASGRETTHVEPDVHAVLLKASGEVLSEVKLRPGVAEEDVPRRPRGAVLLIGGKLTT